MSRLTIACYLSVLFFLYACSGKKTLFTLVPGSSSGIHFTNTIVENDSINPADMINVYNGGGVGIGDFNKDGLPDIYFTGNLVPGKLYINKGDLHFEDVTATAGVDGAGRWCKGAAVVDINNDGWPDLHVSVSISTDPGKRKDLLYINQGVGKDGVPRFREMAASYGLDDTSHSTMAVFFDYDHDGDLDMYLVVNENIRTDNPNFFRPIHTDGSHASTGRLYRNDWNDSLKHPFFTNVSRQSGILTEGYGHGATITDINRDGWPDIYVTNDFLSNDILYINNRDGTFTDRTREYFKHTSATAMGQDVEDINNDGLADLVVLDMNPPDNYRKKTMMGGNNYLTYQNSDLFGYQYQYVRNTLQLNRGPRVGQNDSIGAPAFSEIGWYAGMSETDWSWTPMVVDLDDDGYRDMVVTNGYPKDVTDHDFTVFRAKANDLLPKADLLKQIPEVKLHKYAFRNNGDCSFTDVSADWGMTAPAYSNGAAYADLDGDGDLDLVISNINDEAMVYRNEGAGAAGGRHFLNIKLAGADRNKDGLGARIELHYDHGKLQVYENSPFRGYLSTVENVDHFGLGSIGVVDSVVVFWPEGRRQVLEHVAVDRLLRIDIRDARTEYKAIADSFDVAGMFREVTDSLNVHYRDSQPDFIDFNIQKLLPHKLSEYGPGLAVGDVDGNGTDDIVVGAAWPRGAQLFLQRADGTFGQRAVGGGDGASGGGAGFGGRAASGGGAAGAVAGRAGAGGGAAGSGMGRAGAGGRRAGGVPDPGAGAGGPGKKEDDMGLMLFDADGDGDLDLYIASGGYRSEAQSGAYRDRLYVNDGKGHFSPAEEGAVPVILDSKFCVRAADIDHDGDLDLFVSGRVDPGHYPRPVSSRILRNETRDGHIRFVDVTAAVAPDLVNMGMVCDGVWTDLDNDGWPDLVLAGEWMPVAFLRNDKGVLRSVGAGTGVNDRKGWWNSIIAADVDNDGDMDYVVGNMGLNSFYKARPGQPARVYAGDFDKNGIYDMIPSLYLPDRDGVMKEFPAESRDDLLRQMTSMRKKFPDYKSYAVATMEQVLTPAERSNALVLEANEFRSCLFRNDGQGKFTCLPLPMQAQLSVINGMMAEDLDGDGKLDLVLSGNDYGTEVSVGRYDAFNGLVLKGDGKCGFRPLSILESGIYLPGNQKALVKMRGAGGGELVAASQHKGRLQVFRLKRDARLVALSPGDVSALIRYADGSVRKEEIGYGGSFLSQSGRFIRADAAVRSVEISDSKGAVRILQF